MHQERPACLKLGKGNKDSVGDMQRQHPPTGIVVNDRDSTREIGEPDNIPEIGEELGHKWT